MEKTAKKKKKSKSLKRRIGVIAVGGLSLVLTVCLSVGATLAWFAGSTWASKNMYMGGPVYVEMAGRGIAEGEGSKASWVGGDGNLDIKANAARTTGTVVRGSESESESELPQNQTAPSDVLLPGQKIEIYSQARVYSTSDTNTVTANSKGNEGSGSNTTNIANGKYEFQDATGRVTTTTSSVLRARFSINIDFDSSVGFNNFTDREYADNYPVQSQPYSGHYGDYVPKVGETPASGGTDASKNYVKNAEEGKYDAQTKLPWQTALVSTGTYKPFDQYADTENDKWLYSGRRDAVDDTITATREAHVYTAATANAETDEELAALEGGINHATAQEQDLVKIRLGTLKSIYKWKYVSAYEYNNLACAAAAPDSTTYAIVNKSAGTDGETAGTVTDHAYMQMGYPFNGGDKSSNSNGYYGVWILEKDATSGKYTKLAESDGFYKARCNAYLNTYIEHYKNEYGNWVTRTIGNSLTALDKQLNNYFVKLVNDSSDAIQAGYTNGFTVSNGQKDYTQDSNPNGLKGATVPASWLYIDPSIGNDTNTNEISTSTGGWWYLVESQGEVKSNGSGTNAISTVADYVTSGQLTQDNPGTDNVNEYSDTRVTEPRAITTADGLQLLDGDTYANVSGKLADSKFTRANTDGNASGEYMRTRLYAKLYEIKPNTILTDQIVGYNNNGTPIYKTVSEAFPFVNGTFALPTDAMTNLFANAKISFQISFQALQAFFPYTETIDKINYTSPLLGTAKALNIGNAIPIFNEAFDYSETFTNEDVIL